MDEDLTVMWNTFYLYETKNLIEVDAKRVKLIEYILKMLKHLQSSFDDEIYC